MENHGTPYEHRQHAEEAARELRKTHRKVGIAVTAEGYQVYSYGPKPTKGVDGE